MTQVVAGLAASPGVGIGLLLFYRSGVALPAVAPPRPEDVNPATEWTHFQEAHAKADAELVELCENSNSLVAEIFAAHRVILQDKTLLDAVERLIYSEGLDAASATHTAISELADLFRTFEDAYFAGRAVDIVDLGQRLLAHLGAASRRARLGNLPANTILAAEDLTPSELAQLPPGHVLGIALAYSAPTAHSAILARSMGIPLVCSIGPELLHLAAGQRAIVDGNLGRLLVNVDEAEVAHYAALQQRYVAASADALANADRPAIMRDGTTIAVLANANSPLEVAQSRSSGADGIGLLRTEYLFYGRSVPPSFDEQVATYTHFIGQVDRQLTVRALDAGGDKPVAYLPHLREENPFLGLRGIRLLMVQPEILATQYRALQAAHAASAQEVDVRFMLPMISTSEEVSIARAILAAVDVATGLPALPLGIMIEVPSAALISHILAPQVDFFSIGTNDLAQYVLATDRTNSSVARVADPLHPAVLQLIRQTCTAAAAAGKPVSLCGEIAGDPLAAPLLVGLGVNELSAPLPAVALVKEMIRRVDLETCHILAAQALTCAEAAGVRELLNQPFEAHLGRDPV